MAKITINTNPLSDIKQNVILYCRTARSGREDSALERQTKELLCYCKEHDYNVAMQVEEVCPSPSKEDGGTIGWNIVIGLCEGIHALRPIILVTDAARLSRDMSVISKYYDTVCGQLELDVIMVNNDYHMSDLCDIMDVYKKYSNNC